MKNKKINVIMKNNETTEYAEEHYLDKGMVKGSTTLHVVWRNGEAIVDVNEYYFKLARNKNPLAIVRMAQVLSEALGLSKKEPDLYWGPIPSGGFEICSQPKEDTTDYVRICGAHDGNSDRVQELFDNVNTKFEAILETDKDDKWKRLVEVDTPTLN